MTDTRRTFLKIASGILTLLGIIGIGIPIFGSLLGPIFRKRETTWAEVASLSSLPMGQPVSVKFSLLTEDAYIHQTVFHSVWIIKHAPAAATVFSTICPHLGCHYNWDPQTQHFECPCHGSVYTLDGKVIGGPAPRPLDTLPAKIENGKLYVEWEEFQVGIPQKLPV